MITNDYIPVIGAIVISIYMIGWCIKNHKHYINNPSQMDKLNDCYLTEYAIKKSMRNYRPWKHFRLF